GFRAADLADGYAIMYHDALASAAAATRAAAQGRPVPRAVDVRGAFDLLHLANVVRAASGDLWFEERGTGRAVGKLVVYRQIGSGAPTRLPADPGVYRTTIGE